MKIYNHPVLGEYFSILTLTKDEVLEYLTKNSLFYFERNDCKHSYMLDVTKLQLKFNKSVRIYSINTLEEYNSYHKQLITEYNIDSRFDYICNINFINYTPKQEIDYITPVGLQELYKSNKTNQLEWESKDFKTGTLTNSNNTVFKNVLNCLYVQPNMYSWKMNQFNFPLNTPIKYKGNLYKIGNKIYFEPNKIITKSIPVNSKMFDTFIGTFIRTENYIFSDYRDYIVLETSNKK